MNKLIFIYKNTRSINIIYNTILLEKKRKLILSSLNINKRKTINIHGIIKLIPFTHLRVLPCTY